MQVSTKPRFKGGWQPRIHFAQNFLDFLFNLEFMIIASLEIILWRLQKGPKILNFQWKSAC